MTKHGGTFKLSGETRDLLRKNTDFFEQISALNGAEDPEKIPLILRGKDPKARTEAKIQANGDVEVSFVYPIDDNADSEDGRIELRDTFLFDSAEQKLKSFNRSVEYNGKGQGNWQAWFEKYKATIDAAPLKIEDAKVQKFATEVARSFGRPITDEDGSTLPEIRDVLKKDPSYVAAAHALIVKQREQFPQLPEMVLKIKDNLNFYTIVHGEENLELVLNIAVDADGDAANGRIQMKDRFILDAKTMALKELKRSWELAPESAETEDLKGLLAALQNEAPPSQEEAAKFIGGMLPVLLYGSDRDAAGGLAKLVTPRPLPKDYRSPFARRISEAKQALAATPAGVVESLETMAALSHATLGQSHEASLGWWDRKVLGKASVDLNGGEAAIQGLFQKAVEQLKATPTASAFEVLKAVKVDGAEAALRERLLADPRAAQLNSIGRETDDALRAKEFLAFARDDLVNHFEFAAAGVQIAQRLRSNETLKASAEEILALAEGRGSFGAKMEVLTPRFVKQIADWKTLAAMGAAPFLGTFAELGGLKALSAMGKVRTISGAGRFGASVVGMGFEAVAFTGIHKGLESAVHDPSKVWATAPKEILGATLLFGSMRFGHALSGRFARSMADGKWGTMFGGKTAGEGLGFVVSPTGRVLEDQLMTGSLTQSGRIAASVANHGSGISAMYVAGAIGRKYGLHPEDKKNLGEHWFDAALMYTQASVGFSLANKMTGGKLQGSLAEMKVRTSQYAEAPAKEEAPAEKADRKKPITLKPRTGAQQFALKSEGHTFQIDIKNLNRIWIGRSLGGREGVDYPDAGLAMVNVGDKYPDVSQYHAMILKDETGIFWYVGDTGSVYGTYVNGKRLEPGEYVLAKPNALIELGDAFKFRLEPDGTLLEPDPRVTTIVRVPVSNAQRPVEAPKPATNFPMELLFPEASLPKDATAQVAQLKSSRGQEIPLTNDKAGRTFQVKGNPIIRIYVDAKGRWVLQKIDPGSQVEMARPGAVGGKRWTLEVFNKDSSEGSQPGRGRQDWVFLHSGDQIYLKGQIFDFKVLDKPKLMMAPPPAPRPLGKPEAARPAPPPPPKKVVEAPPASAELPSDERPTLIRERRGVVPPPPSKTEPEPAPAATPVAAAVPEESPEADFEGDRPTLVTAQAAFQRVPDFDNEPTRPGIPMPIDMPDGFPGLLLGQIPRGEAPFVLASGLKGFTADLRHTRYILGSDPKRSEGNQVEVQVEGIKVDASHAEIYLGRKGSDEEYQWFLSPHPDSERGVFVDGYRQLRRDERVPLTPGRTFSLGAMSGERGGVEFTFDIPWLKKSASTEAPEAAKMFPTELISHLREDQPTMEIRSNFGTYLLRGDRKTTRYVLGSGTQKPVGANAVFCPLQGEKIAPEHVELFLDGKGQWYLRALSDSHPTYFKGKAVPAGTALPLNKGDVIELGGNPQEGLGLTLLFDKPEYLKPEASSSRPPASEADEDDAEPVSERDLIGPETAAEGPVHTLTPDMIKTVVPPQGKPRRPPPMPPQKKIATPPPLPDALTPALPRVAAPQPLTVETPLAPPAALDLKTGVFSVHPDLLAQSALGDRDDPPPTVQRPTSRPPAPEPAKVDPDNPMAGWGEEFIAEGLVDAPGTAANAAAQGPGLAPPLPRVEAVVNGVGPVDSASAAEGDGIQTLSVGELPRVVPASTPPMGGYPGVAFTETMSPEELSALNPSLRSSAILHWVEPLLKTERADLKLVLNQLRFFPQLTGTASKRLVGSTQRATGSFEFFSKLTELSPPSDKGADASRPSSETLERMYDNFEKFRPLIRQTYRMESDGANLKLSAFPEDGSVTPDTLLSIAVKPGTEAETMEALTQHFLTLQIPIEVVTPIHSAEMKTPYVGVYFRAENADSVFQAAEGLSQSHAPILDAHLMQFSHLVLSSQGKPLPGMGVMEHFSDGTRKNLQEARVYAIATAYNQANRYVKDAEGQYVPDPAFYLKQALKTLEEGGFDLNNPGFRTGSVQGSHAPVLRRSVSNIFYRP